MGSQTQHEQLAKPSEWLKLELAVSKLAGERALIESSDHRYIVDHLYEALLRPLPEALERERGQKRLAAWEAMREVVVRANVDNRDLVQELIDERREENRRDELGL